MTKGFVTLAVGNDKYYKLAANLLLSYRYHADTVMPFAIVADRENEWTKMFDKVVILPNPSFSYMDKIELLAHPAWDDNVFIDADCLVYKDINSLLEKVTRGVSVYGWTYPFTEQENGWFTKEYLCEFADRVNDTIASHGGIMFYRKDDIIHNIYNDCKNIASHYTDFHFTMFEKPADEPIIALAMAANGCKPINRSENYGVYGFFPTLKKYKMDIRKGLFSYTFDGNSWVNDVMICHWQNHNTCKPLYLHQVDMLKYGDRFLLNLFLVCRKVWLYCRLWLGNIFTKYN